MPSIECPEYDDLIPPEWFSDEEENEDDMQEELQQEASAIINEFLRKRVKSLEQTCEDVIRILSPSGYGEVVRILKKAIDHEVRS